MSKYRINIFNVNIYNQVEGQNFYIVSFNKCMTIFDFEVFSRLTLGYFIFEENNNG
jgi:hypothetical protein